MHVVKYRFKIKFMVAVIFALIVEIERTKGLSIYAAIVETIIFIKKKLIY